MKLLDRFRAADDSEDGTTEQLAPDDPAPRGESREASSLISYLTSSTPSRRDSQTIETDVTTPPAYINRYWRDYYKGFSITRRALLTFSRVVAEPGYKIEATVDEETDEEMQEALQLWAENSVIHAGEARNDLSVLIREIPAQRRGKGTLIAEITGTEADPDAIDSLLLHDPATFRIYKRANKALLTQPDDNVERTHPTTPDGKAAAYVQYDEALPGNYDNDPIAFSKDRILKFTYDPDTGEVWGTSVFEAIEERIDALNQKWRDRDTAIHRVGHSHRVYSSESWTPDQAEHYAKRHKNGDISAWADGDKKEDTWAGRVDFIGGDLDIENVEGTVADIDDAVKDDIEAIMAVMPVSKYRIAYAEDINQFVVEPQADDDDQRVDDERRYIERKLTPVLERKADELASGETYEGDVALRIEPDEEANPLQRESFPKENLEALTASVKALYTAGADPAVINAVLANAGYDIEELQAEYGFAPDDLATLEADESTPAGQAQAEAAENQPTPGDDAPPPDEADDTEEQ